MKKEDKITDKLEEFFHNDEFTIFNNSEQHKHHSGYSDGESHFLIEIKSNKLITKTILEKHKFVFHLLGKEITNSIHSIELKFKQI